MATESGARKRSKKTPPNAAKKAAPAKNAPVKKAAAKNAPAKKAAAKKAPPKPPAPKPPETGWTDRVPTSPELTSKDRTRQETLPTPAELHADYVQQRVESDVGPAPDAYARARAQWRRLPGAVSASAADGGEPPPPTNDRSSRK
jgi:hypothetical protein